MYIGILYLHTDNYTNFMVLLMIGVTHLYLMCIKVVCYPGWDRIYSIPEVLLRLIPPSFPPPLERVSKPLSRMGSNLFDTGGSSSSNSPLFPPFWSGSENLYFASFPRF